MRKLFHSMILLAVCTAGCNVNAPNSITMHAEGGNPEIRINTPGLNSECELVTGRVLYEGDILLGIVTVRSHVDEKKQYHHRWRWYDADGVQITTGGGGETWTTTWVDALDEPQIQGRATAPGAVTAEYQIRWINPDK